MSRSLILPNEAATIQLGQTWSKCLVAPCVVYLLGDLGAGKTTFTRAFLRGLGYTGTVKSPTYALVESYNVGDKKIHHFDLYRFSSPEEWDDAGLSELFTPNSICFIEWPQQGGKMLPAADLIFELVRHEEGRMCTVSALSPHGQRSLDLWQN